MARIKLDRFLDLVRRSGLVEPDQLKRALLRLKEEAGGQPITDSDRVGRRLVEAGLLSRWQCQKLLEGRHKGFFIGKYRLLDHLGTGGMSMVYLAEHVLMQRRVAIKVLPKARVQDTSYLARFHREARAAAALDHRNIVRAYDVDHEGDVHYLVMEYVEGRDVATIVKEDGPLEYAVAADYVRQAAEGLDHAHAAGLIHRDVKPANLLVDQSGVVKLLDLGLARFTGEESASLTVAHEEHVLGTADYLAPEQALDSHGVDGRADIYGLGCSLYYMLTGHPPFAEGTLPQRLMRHQKDPPPSVYEDRADAPQDLVGICLRMMAKKPDERPQSASQVAGLLADWLTDHGHSFDSGSGSGGLSGRLAAAAAEVGREAAASEGPGPQAREPGSDAGPAPPKRGPKSDTAIRRAKPILPAASPGPGDTATAAKHTTVKRTGKPATVRKTGKPAQRASAGGQSGAGAEPAAVIIAQAEAQADVPRFLAPSDSPALARFRSRHQLSTEQIESYRTRRRGTPLWVWALVGLGTLLALVLLVILAASG